jgi:hypothetical protein
VINHTHTPRQFSQHSASEGHENSASEGHENTQLRGTKTRSHIDRRVEHVLVSFMRGVLSACYVTRAVLRSTGCLLTSSYYRNTLKIRNEDPHSKFLHNVRKHFDAKFKSIGSDLPLRKVKGDQTVSAHLMIKIQKVTNK